MLFVFVQKWVAGLLRPRPFLGQLSKAQSNRKFCERHSARIMKLLECFWTYCTRDEGHDVEVVDRLGDGEEGEDEGEHGDGGQARNSPCPRQIF